MRRISFAIAAAIALGGVVGTAMAEDVQPGLQKEVTLADGCLSQEGAEFKEGKWVLPDGTPTFHVCHKDNKYVVDWATYNGYRRYHGECHVCHGPNGLGSTYAPALANSLQTMDYGTFLGTVASGRTRDEAGTKFVMPAFGDNKNVMCFINDLYVYLKARSFEALPAGQLGGRNRDEKPQEARDEEKSCLGS
ncbi:Cytochrome c-553I [Hyphomicrobium sp. 1Nfss2.1]|uniref:c-type cytochrome, methanol metabolism-related n=1 Tax=Hyphomicrobium sp. 1Nfss2.1 TaxID=3413936 RepID=UPI003C7D1053